jgi:transcriptional regulator with XRE-family HTH domain
MDSNELGHIIQQRREALSLKQEDLAEMTGITSKTIYLIESGKGNPSINTLQKILEVLGLEIFVQIRKVEEGNS